MDLARIVLDAPRSPLADPVARLDPDLPPPPDVAAVHAPVRAAIAAAIATVADERRAQMVLVTGEPGMGKTHQLARLRARGHGHGADGGYACVDIPPLKDAGAPFAHLARYAVQGLAAAGQLERLLWDTLRRIAAAVRADADEHGDDALVARIDEAIVGGASYSLAFRALAQHDPGLGRLLYQRGRRLAPLSTLPAEFGRVLCRITDRDAEPALIDWLRAAELTDDDLALLDVKAGVDGEDRAFEVLRALAAVSSARPLVLCVDQLESTAGLLGTEGLVRLFTALMEIYQQAPIAIVLMCQTQQWIDLRREVPLAALQRISVLPPLAKPTAEEAAAIVASRMEPLWEAAGAAPPYPSWPFSPDFVDDLVTIHRPTIRQVLLECDARLGDMRRDGRIVELARVAPGRTGPTTPRATTVRAPTRDGGDGDVDVDVEWIAGLRAAHDRFARAVAERRDLDQPKFRQEHLREALLDLLRGAGRQQRRLGGVTIAAVTAPRKPRNAPRPPALITARDARGAVRIALDVHSDDARFAFHALERLRHAVDSDGADVAVLIREADMPLGDGARRSLEVAAALAAGGGGVVYIGRHDAIRLVAAELLLDAAAAAEILVDRRQASRAEVLEFLLQEPAVVDSLANVVNRVAAPHHPHAGHDAYADAGRHEPIAPA